MVVSRVGGPTVPHYNKRLAIIQVGGDGAIVIFGINRSGAFTDLKSLELVVPTLSRYRVRLGM